MSNSRTEVPGLLAEHLVGYRRVLAELGYSERATRSHIELLEDLSGWMQGKDLDLAGLTGDRVAEFLEARRRNGAQGLLTTFGVGPLLGYLAAADVLPSQGRPGLVGPGAALLSRYRDYLVSERGLAAPGVVRYERVAQLFVKELAMGADVDWSTVTAADVSRFLVKQCTGRGGSSARNLIAGLRSFLRFAQLEGCTAVGLANVIPPVSGWRGRSVPCGLEQDAVRRLLGSCDRQSEAGRRDFAILLLLVRLGLRASEVAAIQLEDVDWRAGEMVVHGKGSRDERLPLPNDVGAAVADYLRKGRPQTTSRSVFVRLLAPRQGLTPTCVTMVVYRASDRAGVSRVGAHRLRHTAASETLRAGASMSEVGQLLRQRAARTTAIYAKVDLVSLRSLARPWPAGAA